MSKGGIRVDGSKARLWRERIAACEGSGRGVASWCDEAGVKVHSYRYWKRRLARLDSAEASEGGGGFASFTLGAAVSEALAADEVEVVSASGLRLRVGSGVPAERVGALMLALGRSC